MKKSIRDVAKGKTGAKDPGKDTGNKFKGPNMMPTKTEAKPAKTLNPETKLIYRDPKDLSSRVNRPKKTESDVTPAGKRPPRGKAREQLINKFI